MFVCFCFSGDLDWPNLEIEFNPSVSIIIVRSLSTHIRSHLSYCQCTFLVVYLVFVFLLVYIIPYMVTAWYITRIYPRDILCSDRLVVLAYILWLIILGMWYMTSDILGIPLYSWSLVSFSFHDVLVANIGMRYLMNMV